jgi:hypothetical protein
VLENILNSQRPYSEKYGLGYKNVHFEEGSSSMMKETWSTKECYATKKLLKEEGIMVVTIYAIIRKE